jgi:butyrate kinase
MTVAISDTNRIPDLLRVVDDLDRYEVQIGVFGGRDAYDASGEDVVTIAFANEFGYQNIPERSFLRAGFDSNQSRINQICESLLDRVLQGDITVAAMYEAIGAEITGMIQDYMTNLRDPPNAPATIEQKGSSNPLIDTGQLRSSITWKVVRS